MESVTGQSVNADKGEGAPGMYKFQFNVRGQQWVSMILMESPYFRNCHNILSKTKLCIEKKLLEIECKLSSIGII